MAKYLILIYGDERQWEANSPEEWEATTAGHRAFRAMAGSTGVSVIDSGQLELTPMATTLRAGDGANPSVTDGPFLETKEVLGGYYVIDAPDLDHATALVSTLREVAVAHSGVEIRPLVGSS